MSSLAEKAAAAHASFGKSNPANAEQTPAAARTRIPMSVPIQRLQVDELPGYHLHWMLGTPERLMQAQKAGYDFVSHDEIHVNNLQLGGDAATSGTTDLGTRVSTLASIGSSGETDGSGQPLRLYLMKIKEDWYLEDQRILEQRNDSIAAALTAGMTGSQNDAAGDAQHRYVDKSRTKIPDMFKPKRRGTTPGR